MIAQLFLAAAVSVAPAPALKDTHIVNRATGHLFVTLHPDGSYTCNPHRSVAEVFDSGTGLGGAWVGIYYALCGHRR